MTQKKKLGVAETDIIEILAEVLGQLCNSIIYRKWSEEAQNEFIGSILCNNNDIKLPHFDILLKVLKISYAASPIVAS